MTLLNESLTRYNHHANDVRSVKQKQLLLEKKSPLKAILTFVNFLIDMKRKKMPISKNYFEERAWRQNGYVCGIDEAGRGSLAGPLVVAAAILPQQTDKNFLKDSKVMSKREREIAYEWITQNALSSVVTVDVQTIETKNIYNATRHAMTKAFRQIKSLFRPKKGIITHLVTDAVKIPKQIGILEQHNPVRAESISPSVAAASIVAKVFRDRLMAKLSNSFPEFTFDQHNGYGTAQHTKEIKTHGITIVHRKSFLSNIIGEKSEYKKQQTIC